MESEKVNDDDVDMKDDGSDDQSQNSTSTEPSSDDDLVEQSKISALEKQITENPYAYDPHVQLINLKRKLGDLDGVREARENMSKIFPLTPELWLDWLTDEEKLASTEEEKKAVIALCERAVKDYTSVSLWLEYVQFMIGQMGSAVSIEVVRETFEKALIAVGLHVTEGSLVWDAYREFEIAMLSTIECATEDSDDNREANAQKQKMKIYSLFKRQVSVPLMHMEKTFEEFEREFPGSTECRDVEWQYQEAHKKLEQIMPFEDALFHSEAPHLEEYKNYIQFEKKNGNPSRVQILYERALLENCLLPELWTEYVKYLDSTIKQENVVVPACERAIRNCPWSVDCWKNYGMVLERYGQSHETIKGVYEKALSSGLSKGEEYREIWLGYLDYLRRRIKWEESHNSELEELLDVFNRAIEHMTYFLESDLEWAQWALCSVLQYKAKVEAKYCKKMSDARKTWNEIMDYGQRSKAEMWINFANFEKAYGDDKHYRQVLLRALNAVQDFPETIGDMLLTFEREEGTLESLYLAREKYDSQMQIFEERRQKRAEKEALKKKLEEEREAERKQLKAERAKAKGKAVRFTPSEQLQSVRSQGPNESGVRMDSEGFKIPSVPSKVHISPEKRENPQRTIVAAKRSSEEEPEHESKKQKTEEDEGTRGQTVQHDPLKDERTVFLSNLAYTTEEKEIKEMFSEVGNVEEVRLVRDYRGRSKGYCYVVYSNRTEAESALKKDRSKLNGRPVFVSPCQDKKTGTASQPKFKFGTGLEKNKLFVKGLPFSTTEDDLKEIFKQYGALKEVRLVTYRNGHSKGLAYVEFETEAEAAVALVKTDGSQIGEHTISVAISNPPERKPKKDQLNPSSVTVSNLLGGGGRSAYSGPRGKGRTQLSLVPRALQRPVAQPRAANSSQKTAQNVQNGDSNGSVGSSSAPSGAKLSNADFRNLLMKKS